MVPLKKETTSYPPLNLNAVFKGLLAAIITTILGSAVSGVVYHVTTLSEQTLPLASSGLFYFSIFTGSVFAAREAGCKGLVHGIGVALLFVLFGWLLANLFLNAKAAFLVVLQKTIISLVTGALGGVLGVGLSR
ncbi:TIGR04086 family membrane protein [Desulfoscipio geothermicus]|uniref:Putative membrane protein, TIGR04086 family n=1 Tax=Desulfoscipio geothermicus DSM 3669 TaxID=1121426 RepID=A0A1I6DM13_9FIRM|nr:TIGR04086 family membrane protein [Desulfoscipio geothermicus]SFR06431.1 putative membrane protein, TIGR04086 family [Desulfoscipio geothermicus DSM 3669]